MSRQKFERWKKNGWNFFLFSCREIWDLVIDGKSFFFLPGFKFYVTLKYTLRCTFVLLGFFRPFNISISYIFRCSSLPVIRSGKLHSTIYEGATKKLSTYFSPSLLFRLLFISWTRPRIWYEDASKSRWR